MVTMTENAKAVEKQAIVSVLLGQSLSDVERIAKARKWHGNVKKKLVNRFLHLKAGLSMSY